ncbi:hypothetical protein KP803_10455 [Vibrio sp. ZSDE26]|uniref:Solute-binding protein family 3/N-terminal domain-containing protein n=1 Tax=Vibrio amylolyticus TaxID=2847292 RepID=A0A9X2BL91_9VIBR|nr:hypothetical protein [Vibrio amylolyticus]MCK6263693.1 hypothetical protein [Vibrio amylolyticus]
MTFVKVWVIVGSWLILGEASAQLSINVLAVEFPPYTTSKLKSDGIAFEKLRSHPAMSDVDVHASFLPPTRIGKQLLERGWCLSFYPPRDKSAPDYYKWILSEEVIKLGFYRLTQKGDLEWDDLSELKGYSVAMLSSYSKLGLSGLVYSHGLDVHEINTLDQGFELLTKERVDLLFADKYSGEFIAIEYNYELQDIEFSNSFIATEQFHVWLNLSCTDLVEKVKPYMD